ncbi:unnamed protein product [Acanthoscelides obtectus]|uniref:Uncharacterized protein n=1 Tax=Acanthoscelides obtectus TaxID=200917 RepID=A0A9P0KI94_ACAOB|nr:unnamed protein product [Acanthoscelides obtectus]CAK1656703.1 hypothetical protein AOBTE_LOCUS19875 [Acanthoscelides obtectus]
MLGKVGASMVESKGIICSTTSNTTDDSEALQFCHYKEVLNDYTTNFKMVNEVLIFQKCKY